MADPRENVIEWITGDDRLCLTLTQKRMITKVKKIVDHYREMNDARADYIENSDGSVFAHLPLEVLKLGVKRNVILSEDERETRRERMAALRRKKDDMK
jgi:hypothetical protein